jgi:hypothetical protein
MNFRILLLAITLQTIQLKAQNDSVVVNASTVTQTIYTALNNTPGIQSKSNSINFTYSPSPCNSCPVNSFGVQVNQNGTYFFYRNKNDAWQTLLVFLPVLLFGIILFVVISWLNRSGFKLADMLSENSPSEIDVENPDPEARKTIPFVPKKILPRSTSRLVALLSGLCSVAIATCATSYYFDIYLKTGKAPDLKNLFDILLSLGLGVVPYAVNKVSGAFTGGK